MTLISFSTNYGRPVLIGDLLTTSIEQGNAIQIPAFLADIEKDLPKSQQSYPFGLKQKIYVIKERIALGLAGNVYQMTIFLEDIKSFFNYHEPTEKNFKIFMDGYDQQEISECSILVFIVEESIEGIHPSIHHYGEWEEYNDPLIQCGLITGSGKSAFFHKLSLLENQDTAKNEDLNTNLTLLSIFLADEKYTMDSLVNSWGAGFEVIEYIDGKLKKRDNLTYIVCHCELDETRTSVSSYPFLIMHYIYHGEVLTINTYLENEFRRYGILPLDLRKEDMQKEDVQEYNGFESSQVLCAFVIEKEDGGFFYTSVLTNPDDGFDAIKVKFAPPDNLEVQIDEKIFDKILCAYNDSLSK